MSDADATASARARRFDWHPEPELIDVLAPGSRAELERLGTAAWATALDYVFDEGLRRSFGEPADYEAIRALLFGPTGEPAPAPPGPTRSRDLLAEFTARIAPHSLHAWHPRTLSYFTPPPLWLSVVGELLAQVTQQGIDVWHAGPAGALVEEEVVRWLCDLVGYGAGSFGLLTSGGVMANFLAMALARDIHLRQLRDLDRAPRGAALEGVRIYASDQAHFSIGRALDELGFPRETLVAVPTDGRFRLHGAPVAEAIAADRARGLTPLAIAAVAGSTSTGSVDLTGELADVAEREGLWLHVDAAYGGGALLSRRDAPRIPDLARADSITVDPHKWFFQAYDIGALVVRRRHHLDQAFDAHRPVYYRGGGDAAARRDTGHGEQLDFYRLGFEGTRRFRALKLWLSWKHLGTDGLGRLIEMNDDMAAHLTRRCLDSDDFEVALAEPELSVVCLRHLPGGRDAALRLPAGVLDAHQDQLQAALERSGDGWLSTTRLRGSTWLRAGILNYLTEAADLDRLLDTLRELALKAA